jgi:hypothetical protein
MWDATHVTLRPWREARMTSERRYRSVPLQRRWMNELVHFGKKSHVMGYSWRVNIAAVVAARTAEQSTVGWAAIWMKALALVGRRRPELRTSYLPFPWARLYVHPESVCTVVVERTWQGVSACFFEQFNAPDKTSLTDLDNALRSLRQVPVESVGSFRRLIRFSRPPVLVRRLIWSAVLYWSGPLRAAHIGTSGLNPFPTGGTITQSAMPASFMLYYGLVEPNGDAPIQIFYDHRVMDGVDLYRILRDLEATMNRDIVAELRQTPTSAKNTSPQAQQNRN